ncbi:ATP-binding protein [Kitasatospora sp. NBC_01287]|uniref:ATP-binding protein n=1 Tax=Kitasatospora sp. NBC_01287 TaxID=2903573 RepID=UPI00225AB65D|nr:ATP-binding protein [Kitasatospora sp. NBC_01287]MCX4744149.1 ATP-binding protein [Kitasatospora sp. NBC_01287]
MSVQSVRPTASVAAVRRGRGSLGRAARRGLGRTRELGRLLGRGRPPASGRGRRRAVLKVPRQVRDCREFTRRTLGDWGWLPAADRAGREWADDVLLLVSELATNAFLHAGGPEYLRLRRGRHALRVEVADREGDRLRPHRPDPLRPGGYGLHLVHELAADWGVAPHRRRRGKSVWFEVRTPR